MSNGFILRFDDLCPTLNWKIWNPIEEFLVEAGIKPILAVVPENRDKGLVHSAPGENFLGSGSESLQAKARMDDRSARLSALLSHQGSRNVRASGTQRVCGSAL